MIVLGSASLYSNNGPARAAAPTTILPSLNAEFPSQATKGHGGPNIRPTFYRDKIEIDFEHKAGSDDYLNIDLGKIDLGTYSPGGYVEFTVECPDPIVQAGVVISSPNLFWETRQTIEGLFALRAGKHSYRIYLDSLIPHRRKSIDTDHIYLFIRDMKAIGIGKAKLLITRIAVMPQTDDWKEQKSTFYNVQFPPLPDYERIEPYYREDFKRGTNWSELKASPFLRNVSLSGNWRKKAFGERYWSKDFLSDMSYAQKEFDDSPWSVVRIPEAPIDNQPGGYFWYRKTFQLPKQAQGSKVYLRCEDISEDASLYINGDLVGTQSSVDKTAVWVGDGLGRTTLPPNTSLADALGLYFKRYEIPMPFDVTAIPVDAQRIAFPISTGQFQWPLVYEVSDLLKDGDNVIAIRVHGNPIRGYWIYRHRDDRAASNVFGVLGDISLTIQKSPVLETFSRAGSREVDSQGMAKHQFTFSLSKGGATECETATLQCEGQRIDVPLTKGRADYKAEISLPARFTNYSAQLSIFDRRGGIVDQRRLSFHGAVIGLANGQLAVNGEPFLVRGICASSGVEFQNDRHTTRREFLRMLKVYQQIGLNTIRLDVNDFWQLQTAFENGFMVLPILANASTDLSGAAFGRVDAPDLELALDRHRLGVLLYRDAPNILMWNIGNEISHMPGRDDKENVNAFLNGALDVYRQLDPDGRLLTFSSYDAWILNWFFVQGDIIGWNHYGEPDALAQDMQDPERLAFFSGKPYLFTEWGLDFNERKRSITNWERKMREKWRRQSTTPGCLGAILYPWHGELDDQVGLGFLRSLYLPFTIKNEGGKVVFQNIGESTMREVSFQLVKESMVSGNDYVKEIKPGGICEIALPKDAAGTLEVRYDSHRGLQRFFTQEL